MPKEAVERVNKLVSHWWTGSSVLHSLFCCFVFRPPEVAFTLKDNYLLVLRSVGFAGMSERQKRRRDKSFANQQEDIVLFIVALSSFLRLSL